MELRQLEAFVAVAEERNFTRAAARLHVAQSGLSATIRSLERELHAPLFLRTTRQVELTPAGGVLVVEARRTLAAARAAVEAVAAVEGVQHGTLSLGIMQASSFIDLAGLLIRFRDEYPGIELRLQQSGATELARLLREHAADLILTIGSDEADPEVLSKPLVRSPVIIACRADHSFASKKTIELKQLAGQPLVGFPQGWGVRDLTDHAMQSEGVQPSYAFEVNDTATMLDLVQAGCGVGVLPEVMAALRPELCSVSIKGRQRTWTIAAQVLAPAPPNPAARALWTMLDSL
ncbi:MAG TPA: LysR family transcriptional regulator [Acidimicrobiales bacterium]